MYGPSGSYGSYSGMSAPMDMPSSSSLQSREPNCASPSWPRRMSLSSEGNDGESYSHRATSYISSEDLLALDDPFWNSDARSFSSAAGDSPSSSPPQIQQVTEEEILERQRLQQQAQRDFARFALSEKERRRQAMKIKQRAGLLRKNSGSPKSKLAAMTTIAE